MIHVATVHFLDPKWIKVQARGLRTHVAEPYRVYGCLNGLPGECEAMFHETFGLNGEHGDKLNELARVIAAVAAPDDVLLFLDGDAFPVAPFAPLVEMLDKHPLIAVQRLENLGDPQPHPCFCLTRVGFWADVGGDWSPGRTWVNGVGETTTDPGAQLKVSLEEHGVAWHPLRRSNARDLHPVLFGVYGGRVYHHAAGFRPPLTRADTVGMPASGEPRGRAMEVKRAANQQASDRVYARIVDDETFALRYFEAGGDW